MISPTVTCSPPADAAVDAEPLAAALLAGADDVDALLAAALLAGADEADEADGLPCVVLDVAGAPHAASTTALPNTTDFNNIPGTRIVVSSLNTTHILCYDRADRKP